MVSVGVVFVKSRVMVSRMDMMNLSDFMCLMLGRWMLCLCMKFLIIVWRCVGCICFCNIGFVELEV